MGHVVQALDRCTVAIAEFLVGMAAIPHVLYVCLSDVLWCTFRNEYRQRTFLPSNVGGVQVEGEQVVGKVNQVELWIRWRGFVRKSVGWPRINTFVSL